MIRTFVSGYVKRPEINGTVIAYAACTSFFDTTTGNLFIDDVAIDVQETDTPAQMKTKQDAAIKAAGEAHGLVMTGTSYLAPTYARTVL